MTKQDEKWLEKPKFLRFSETRSLFEVNPWTKKYKPFKPLYDFYQNKSKGARMFMFINLIADPSGPCRLKKIEYEKRVLAASMVEGLTNEEKSKLINKKLKLVEDCIDFYKRFIKIEDKERNVENMLSVYDTFFKKVQKTAEEGDFGENIKAMTLFTKIINDGTIVKALEQREKLREMQFFEPEIDDKNDDAKSTLKNKEVTADENEIDEIIRAEELVAMIPNKKA